MNVNGGVPTPGAGESEVLLDIDTVIGAAPLSNTSSTTRPPSTSFVQLFQAMIADGDTVITNSWRQCEDQTPLADAQAIDSVLAGAAASGITVVNGTGDGGSTCLDGSPNTIGVPADSPQRDRRRRDDADLRARPDLRLGIVVGRTGADPAGGSGRLRRQPLLRAPLLPSSP